MDVKPERGPKTMHIPMTTPSIDGFAQLIPPSLLLASGKAFYAGRMAFSSTAPLYVLGVNPGGDPLNYQAETVESHSRRVLDSLPDYWSAYRDESWEGAAPGTYGMAPRVLHMFRQLDLDPGRVPASNLFFVRSSREADINARKAVLSDMCWPFHARVLKEVMPRVVLCLGATAGKYVRERVGANRCVGQFVERNKRRWISQSFENAQGLRVVVATHPSIADWCAESTDPTNLVRDALR